MTIQHSVESEINASHPKYLDWVQVGFITVLLLSNIASSAKIIDWRMSLGPLRLAFDAGTILFPISYVFGDILTEVYGLKRARKIIWMGFVCLAFSALVFYVIGIMPGEEQWQQYAGQQAYDAILGGMSSGGLVVASLVAYLAGSFSNAFSLDWIRKLTNGRWLWTRTIGSTVIGEGLDSLIFIFVASLFKVFPWELFWTLVITNYVFKVFIEVAMTPITYAVIGWLKKRENVRN